MFFSKAFIASAAFLSAAVTGEPVLKYEHCGDQLSVVLPESDSYQEQRVYDIYRWQDSGCVGPAPAQLAEAPDYPYVDNRPWYARAYESLFGEETVQLTITSAYVIPHTSGSASCAASVPPEGRDSQDNAAASKKRSSKKRRKGSKQRPKNETGMPKPICDPKVIGFVVSEQERGEMGDDKILETIRAYFRSDCTGTPPFPLDAADAHYGYYGAGDLSATLVKGKRKDRIKFKKIKRPSLPSKSGVIDRCPPTMHFLFLSVDHVQENSHVLIEYAESGCNIRPLATTYYPAKLKSPAYVFLPNQLGHYREETAAEISFLKSSIPDSSRIMPLHEKRRRDAEMKTQTVKVAFSPNLEQEDTFANAY